jgi:hypothetical protein
VVVRFLVAYPPRDGRAAAATGFHVAAEGLEVDPLGVEQVQAVASAPGGVLAAGRGVRLAGEAGVPQQSTMTTRP